MKKAGINRLKSRLRRDLDWRQRREAAQRLGMYKSREAVSALAGALDDRDEDVVCEVIHALKKIGDASVVPRLQRPKYMESGNFNIRWASVLALDRLGDRAVIDNLTALVKDDNWSVKNAAVCAICNQIDKILLEQPDDAAHDLILLLSIDDPEIHQKVIQGLCGLKKVSHEIVINNLESKSERVRLGVLDVIACWRHRAFLDPVLKLIQDPDRFVRRKVAGILGLYREPRTIEPLITRLQDSDAAVCSFAVNALVQIGKESTLPLLNALQHGKSRIFRSNIIYTLGELRDERARLELLNCLSSSYYLIRKSAADALIKIRRGVAENLHDFLGVSQVPVMPFVQALSKSKSKRIKLRYIRSLGELKDSRAVPYLKSYANMAERPYSQVAQDALEMIACAAWARCFALKVMSEVGSFRDIPLVLSCVNDANNDVQYEAVSALKTMVQRFTPAQRKKLIKPLMDLKKPPFFVKARAIEVLEIIGKESKAVLDYLMELVKSDPSREVRAEAVVALGRFQDIKAAPVLIDALNDSYWSVRRDAENALSSMGPGIKALLLKSLKTRKQKHILLRSSRLLVDLGVKEAIPLVKKIARKYGRDRIMKQFMPGILKKAAAL
jgi:HEAT repeat protein